MWHRRAWSLVDRRQPHLRHQAPNALAANYVALTLEMVTFPPRSGPWRLQELRIDQAHQF
jgi:hypothetical protein